MKIIFLTMISLLAFAQKSFGSALPPNNLYIEDSPSYRDSNMNEVTFMRIINKVANVYRPIIESHGAFLSVYTYWSDGTVNAYAARNGQYWQILMYGGLARHPTITEDGFTVIVCHEFGHHLGGFPFRPNIPWASAEGQADYWATHECTRAVWEHDTQINKSFTKTVDPVAKKNCDLTWTSDTDRHLCYRSAMASLSAAELHAAVNWQRVPKFDTPAQYVMNPTNPYYSAAQCRLDTYVAGSMCKIDSDDYFIPQTEDEQVGNSCFGMGGIGKDARPRCWFRPSWLTY